MLVCWYARGRGVCLVCWYVTGCGVYVVCWYAGTLEVEGYEWYAGMLVYQGSEGFVVGLTPHDPPKQDHKANTVYRGHFTKGFRGGVGYGP